jgi:hypothetical protein
MAGNLAGGALQGDFHEIRICHRRPRGSRSRRRSRIRCNDELFRRQHGQDQHHDSGNAGWSQQNGYGQGDGNGKHGYEQGQHEGRLYALHEGSEDGRNEKRDLIFPRPAPNRPHASDSRFAPS